MAGPSQIYAPAFNGTGFGPPLGAEYVSKIGVGINAAEQSPDDIAALAVSGAVTIPTTNRTYAVTKAGVAALTVVDPTSGVHDGVRLKFISSTAQAHTLSNAAGSGFNAGGTSTDIGTFGGAIGDNIIIEAYGGKWLVQSKVNVTLA